MRRLCEKVCRQSRIQCWYAWSFQDKLRILPSDVFTYLRYPDVLSHLCSPCPSALIPVLFLARTLSPTKAWARPESVFVLAVMFVAVLGPSGWILSDLDNYKGRE
uniref:Uncharacterized protein n=1 Tax=Poecilia latipinna TaxID=48699 RepID=A0A3B3TSH3_9TELE